MRKNLVSRPSRSLLCVSRISPFTTLMAAEGSAILANFGPAGEDEKNIEQWKIKKLIRSLEAARGYVVSPLND